MKYNLSPKTFEVNELFNPQLTPSGKYCYYILQKSGVSHKEAVKRIGTTAWFCGIKDKNASTKQWFCTVEKIPDVEEENFKIKFRGHSNERIFVGKHKGNAFEVIVELNESEEEALKQFKPKNELICNYFGKQRFSEGNMEIIRALDEKNYESTLQLFLTKKSKFDSERSTRMKAIILANWGKWEEIAKNEEISQTKKRELFEFLAENGASFEEAFAFAEPKSLGVIIKAAQSKRFNEKLNEIARNKKPNNIYSALAGHNVEFALSASKAFVRSIEIEPTEFEKKFRKGLLKRRTFFTVEKFGVKKVENKKHKLSFVLMRGAYATIFLNYLSIWLNNAKKSRKKD